MNPKDRFFIREPWSYGPEARPEPRSDAALGFDTKALHAGYHPLKSHEAFRSFVPPIVQSVTFPYTTFDEIPCPVYGRTRTPTNTVLEERLAALEGGEACVSAASGSQALFNLLFTPVRPGDNVVTSLNIFWEGHKRAADLFPQRCRVTFRFVQDPSDPASWEQTMDARSKLVWRETPSNPCLFVTDIEAVAAAAHERGVPVLVDNTTAPAALQKPLELGADIVLLSISKFLSGNAAVLGGAIVGPEALAEDIRWNTTEQIGAVMPPQDAFLTLQSLETLSLRMHRHSDNARQIAEYLEAHPAMVKVN